ncbi:hypothetical protein HN014_12640 [Aquimarina sp. TRL1]|uniref:hypothetical protein n=1 Tax=Aquimarina sp. (strain TRL1) TaxID=2736252 RepID=UPI00158AEA72|nr:hypothetical protein [Aquimarina sp. TRL1]QKX05720.1 hypothetical protein HN014_12640 [Aquimarina sp. TRL1]
MKPAITNLHKVAIAGIPIVLLTAVILIPYSPFFTAHTATLSLGITLDLLLTIPLVYFLLIRKTNIPKTTLVPVLVLGVITGSYILPEAHQQYLIAFKNWGLPVIEITIVLTVIYKVVTTIKKFKKVHKKQLDFYTAVRETCEQIVPKKIAALLSSEIAIIYYGFWFWKPVPTTSTTFSYHKNSGIITLLFAFIFIIGIETYVLHIWIEKWSLITAWILSGISCYSAIQIFGISKAIIKRPIRIEQDTLLLRFGILSEVNILKKDIAAVTISSAAIPEGEHQTTKLSPLGDLDSHSVFIDLKKPYTIHQLYGKNKTVTRIALAVDQKEAFVTALTPSTTTDKKE